MADKTYFLTMAERIFADLPNEPFLKEAALRTVISRVYYALYNNAYDFLRKTKK